MPRLSFSKLITEWRKFLGETSPGQIKVLPNKQLWNSPVNKQTFSENHSWLKQFKSSGNWWQRQSVSEKLDISEPVGAQSGCAPLPSSLALLPVVPGPISSLVFQGDLHLGPLYCALKTLITDVLGRVEGSWCILPTPGNKTSWPKTS